jgi:heme/copper-type cytochrome/quinol oxidase subunit 3
MNARPALDVASFPETEFGHHATIWWGVVLLLAIEGTALALLFVSDLYLRQTIGVWPPLGTPDPRLGAATANVAVLVGSLAPMGWVHRRALARDRRAIGAGLAVCIVLGLASLALRAVEFRALGARWDSHAYGSIAWTILGMHTAHVVASVLENALLALVMLRGPLQDKHFVDTTVNAIYWYFVVLAWLPLYVLVFLAPRWL